VPPPTEAGVGPAQLAAVTLVLGGTRSGKSEVGERLVGSCPAVTYVATGVDDPGDSDWAARLARHRRRRPRHWSTVELAQPGDLAVTVASAECAASAVLVDSLGAWVARHRDFVVDVDDLVVALGGRVRATILVSDEVGLGVHPSTSVGGQFRDALGEVNRRVAEVSGTVLLVVAGRTLTLP